MNTAWKKRFTLGNESLFLRMIAHPFSRGIRINVSSAADVSESVMKFREWESSLSQKEGLKP
jgi:hypothetical protein